MKNNKITFIMFTTLYLVLGALYLIGGADPDSSFYYFDNLLVRFIGTTFIISGIGLFFKKEIARKGIISALILSLIEIVIGVPQNVGVVELNAEVIFLLILFIPGLMYYTSIKDGVPNENSQKPHFSNKMEISEENGNSEDKVRRELLVEKKINGAVNWFYWIAGLSVINTVVLFFDGNVSFVIGLGITQLIDGFAYDISDQFGVISIICGMVINLLIAGTFVFLGIMARKLKKWSFISGMILYGLDTIIFLIFNDFYGIAFHIVALVCIYNGFKALKKSDEENNKVSFTYIEVE
ncbi:MAG: hypothetical protein ABRQ25_09415 [Clostridiaceae bacterium]